MTMKKIDFKNYRTQQKIKSTFQLTVSYLFLGVLALFILIPFYIIVITAFKTNPEATTIPFTWIPRNGWNINSFREVLFDDVSGGGQGVSSILVGFKNTMIIIIPSTFMGLLTSGLSAYAFAKLRFKGKKIGFTLMLITMMIPGIIMLAPSYMIYDRLGLVGDKFFPLMVPGMFGAAAAVFFLRQFFQGIPDDLLEAAKIDGMNDLMIFFKIMVPLSAPAFIAQGILGLIGGYNDYFGPLLYLHEPSKYTLQIALRFFEGTNVGNWPTVMAGAVISIIPTILVYIIAQRYFVEGITMTGIK